MLATRMIRDIYNSAKEKIVWLYVFVRNLPDFIKRKKQEIRHYIAELGYKLKNLVEMNLKLGEYHLALGNINDAILRFKLVNKFLSPGNAEANYLLGWCYLLKGDAQKAIDCLEKSSAADNIKLGAFLKKHSHNNYVNCQEIPEAIWQQYRNLLARNYADRFYNKDNIHLPYSMAQQIMEAITELPDEYNILELGSNVGLFGDEIRRRFPDSFRLTGVECSISMTELIKTYYPKGDIYDRIIEESPKNFIEKSAKQGQDKFDVIVSYSGLTFVKDLQPFFNHIYSILNTKGYFAFCLPTRTGSTVFADKYGEFVFSGEDMEKALSVCKFKLLQYKTLSLGTDSKYSVYVLLKDK